jgi:hypothetical protein
MRRCAATAIIASILLLGVSCRETSSQTDQEKAIDSRVAASNGIDVGQPKVFDDSLLQQMLNSAQAQLTSLQVLNSTGISSNFGALTGANQQISSFSISAQAGPPLPTIATTDNGATTQVANTAGTQASNGVVTTTTVPVQNITSTLAPPGAVVATPASPTTSLPSAFGVSASDILNEQMQVTYEIANLRLLLEGPLSDRILNTPDGKTFMKPRTTLGFPITISPDKRFKDAAAVVEVEIESSAAQDLSGRLEGPAITALLPREKTYNVAAILDHSVSVGGGVATQLAGVSVAFLHARKSYYLVKDQDTVAMTFTPKQEGGEPRIGFMWQFRPVLGSHYVQAGMKQTFVQLSFPTDQSAASLGKVCVRTYWRKYDRNTALLGDVVKTSLNTSAASSQIPVYPMIQNTALFSAADLEDLGNGQLLVNVPGNFLGGTYVRVGSTILQAGSPGFTSEYGRLRFVATTADLATKDVYVVARDGTEQPLRIYDNMFNKYANPLLINGTPKVTALDESNSLLQVELYPLNLRLPLPLTLVIGGKVFGYNDAPIRKDGNTLSVVLPTSFLIANPEVIVKPLLVNPQFFVKTSIFPSATEIERAVLLQQSSKVATYLFFGRKLTNIKVVEPKITLKSVGTGESDDSLKQFELPIAAAKSLKEIVLQRPGERPFAIAMPALVTIDQTKPQPLKFQERVTVGADDAVIVGDGLNTISKVQYQKKDLTVVKSGDGKSITIKGLTAVGATGSARTVDIDLVPAAGKATTIKLEVVSSKVETVTK